jgi:hypothetical protein
MKAFQSKNTTRKQITSQQNQYYSQIIWKNNGKAISCRNFPNIKFILNFCIPLPMNGILCQPGSLLVQKNHCMDTNVISCLLSHEILAEVRLNPCLVIHPHTSKVVSKNGIPYFFFLLLFSPSTQITRSGQGTSEEKLLGIS